MQSKGGPIFEQITPTMPLESVVPQFIDLLLPIRIICKKTIYSVHNQRPEKSLFAHVLCQAPFLVILSWIAPYDFVHVGIGAKMTAKLVKNKVKILKTISHRKVRRIMKEKYTTLATSSQKRILCPLLIDTRIVGKIGTLHSTS